MNKRTDAVAVFEDARQLTLHCERKLSELRALHERCLTEQTIDPALLIETKNFMENLRSALDYCAVALYAKYGASKREKPKPYFPYAAPGESRQTFRETTVERGIPGLLASRPDVVDRLEECQYFGNTGNWLPLLAKLTNEHKHNRLTPQIAKQYKFVHITATIPPGSTVKINLKKIPLGGGPDKPFHAVAGDWMGFHFTDTGTVVMPLLEGALPNVRSAVEELSRL